MPKIKTSDGVNLYYEEAGAGTPVVFVHEFAGDYRTWEPQMRRFSRAYRCVTSVSVAIRLRTFPTTPRATARASPALMSSR